MKRNFNDFTIASFGTSRGLYPLWRTAAGPLVTCLWSLSPPLSCSTSLDGEKNIWAASIYDSLSLFTQASCVYVCITTSPQSQECTGAVTRAFRDLSWNRLVVSCLVDALWVLILLFYPSSSFIVILHFKIAVKMTFHCQQLFTRLLCH